MTVEEIEIIVTAKVEEALKEFQKIIPTIKQSIKQAQEAFSKVDTKKMTNKLQQSVQFMKKKMQDFKKSSEKNEIAIKVNNKDAEKQINQIQKQINSLQEKINARQMKLNIITPRLDEITTKTTKEMTPDGISSDNPAIQNTINNSLNQNKEYKTLIAQEEKMIQEITMYSEQLRIARTQMTQLRQEINKTGTSQNKLTSFSNAFKKKIGQVKPGISELKKSFNQMSKVSHKLSNNMKKMGTGLKSSLRNVLKYAAALFSLRSIYSVLSNCASSWLSSQNSGAQQLSANIEYMKYAMGSALAPVIQFVTNLVYQLMKAIQSVAYALTGVNIFAKASANSYSSMASSAKKAKEESKQLAGVHDEINNISDNNSSDNGSGTTTPNFDLSQMDNTPNSIIDALKNGDCNQVGETIGQKLNEAMKNIKWDKIQNTARNIGTNIAQFLNGFIATTDWKQVGNTFAQGLNTIIYFGYSFVTTFDWSKLGNSIANVINGFFKNIDWETLAKTISSGVEGILDTISGFAVEIELKEVIISIVDFVVNIDWEKMYESFYKAIGSLTGALAKAVVELLKEAWEKIKEKFKDWITDSEEQGKNIIEGLLKGILDPFAGIREWIKEHIFQPFIDGFKEAFGIHSPSTVMFEQGNFIIQGLFNGIQSLVGKITEIWNNMKSTVIEKFTEIKTSISDIWKKVKETTLETWNNIKAKVKEGAQGAWDGITSIFSKIPNWFKEKFSEAWEAVKKVFSTGGKIFDGIKEGILSGLKTVINAIIKGINKVIKIPFNGINSALRSIKNIDIMGLKPFNWISTISVPQIPQLAKGGVLYDETLVMAGEYSGAKSNPEIVTPQNIMYDTMRKALSDSDIGNFDDRPIYLTVNVGNSKLGQILLDDLRSMKRRSGKNIEALVGG